MYELPMKQFFMSSSSWTSRVPMSGTERMRSRRPLCRQVLHCLGASSSGHWTLLCACARYKEHNKSVQCPLLAPNHAARHLAARRAGKRGLCD